MKLTTYAHRISLTRIMLSVCFIVLVVGLLPVAIASAHEEDVLPAERGEMRERPESERERAANVGARVGEQSAFSEHLRDRIKNLFGNMERRMHAAIGRLVKIADRLESRIEKLEERGVDGSDARGFVEDARRELSAASRLIGGDLDADIDAAARSEEPRVRTLEIRGIFTEAARHIRAAHEALRDALRALQSAVSDVGDQ